MNKGNSISSRFIRFCRVNNITQTKLANAIGLKQSSIFRWFKEEDKNTTLPNLDAVYWLTKNYNLSFDWLMTGIEILEQKSFISNSQIGGIGNSQIGNMCGQQTINSANNDCKDCNIVEFLTETNKYLTTQNEKLTDKLLKKV